MRRIMSFLLALLFLLSFTNAALASNGTGSGADIVSAFDYDPLLFPSPYPIWTNLSDSEIQNAQLTNLQEFADPSLIYHDGVYYVYSTNSNGIVVARSTDNLTSFEHMGLALTSPAGAPIRHYMFWAPDVFYRNGVFYMYYSSSYWDGDLSFGQRLKVATSDNPLGPFVYQKDLEIDIDSRVSSNTRPWAIDPNMVERDGKFYLFFAAKGWGLNSQRPGTGTNRATDYYGTMIFMQQFSDPLTPIPGTRRLVVDPTMREELYDESGNFSATEYCLEGPYYFERDGTGFLMYSGNAWASPYYFVGYATWDLVGDMADAVFQKYPDRNTYQPLVGIDEYATGMGHNSICVTPEGKILMAYHGRPEETRGLPSPTVNWIRRLYISEMTIEDNQLVLHRRHVPWDIPDPDPEPDPDPKPFYPQVLFDASLPGNTPLQYGQWGAAYFDTGYVTETYEGVLDHIAFVYYQSHLQPGAYFEVHYTGSSEPYIRIFVSNEVQRGGNIRPDSISEPGIARFTYEQIMAAAGSQGLTGLLYFPITISAGSTITKLVLDSVNKLDPDKAYITITGPATVASGAGATASYTISAEYMPLAGGIELEFEVDGNYLSSKEFTALGGFEFFGAGNYGTPIYWKNDGSSKWVGKVTLLDMGLAGIGGEVDLLNMVFDVKEGALGTAGVKLNYVAISSADGWVDVVYINDAASTEFVQYYSPFDLNHDGVIDLHDITFAMQYLLITSSDIGWDDAKIIDYNNDGKIDINDLILILANYTIPYYS